MPALPLALLLLVRLYGDTLPPPPALDTALHTAAATLGAAGIRTAFVVCPAGENASGCTSAPRPGELIVRLITRSGTPKGDDALGDAAVDTRSRRGTLATVYLDRIAAFAAAADADMPTLVGHAMAHEIGHLLMGTPQHADSGLMRARWTSADVREPRPFDWMFSGRDARAMRAQLAARTAAAISAPAFAAQAPAPPR